MSVYFIEKNIAFYLVFDHVDLYFFLIYTFGRTLTERSNLEIIGRASKKKVVGSDGCSAHLASPDLPHLNVHNLTLVDKLV